MTGDLPALKDLVEDDHVEVNTPGAQNRTALHKAVGKGSFECVEYLVEKGADLTCRDAGGLTPL